jgi:hypothetical protein
MKATIPIVNAAKTADKYWAFSTCVTTRRLKKRTDKRRFNDVEFVKDR